MPQHVFEWILNTYKYRDSNFKFWCSNWYWNCLLKVNNNKVSQNMYSNQTEALERARKQLLWQTWECSHSDPLLEAYGWLAVTAATHRVHCQGHAEPGLPPSCSQQMAQTPQYDYDLPNNIGLRTSHYPDPIFRAVLWPQTLPTTSSSCLQLHRTNTLHIS